MKLKRSKPIPYSYQDTAQILRAYQGTIPVEQIALDVGRTESAIRTFLWHFEAFKKGKWKDRVMSNVWKRNFEQYLSTMNGHANHLRSDVHAQSKTLDLVAQLDKAMANVKDLTIKVIESEVERRSAQNMKDVQKELDSLREFKQRAQDSNLASILQKTLMS